MLGQMAAHPLVEVTDGCVRNRLLGIFGVYLGKRLEKPKLLL